MDGVVGSVRCRNQEFGIQDIGITVFDFVSCHRIHVMDDDLIVDLMTINAQIQAKISGDNFISNESPLSRCVKALVDVSVEAERGCANTSVETEVFEPLFEAS